MNNTPGSGGRKRTPISSGGSVRKTEKVNTNGPVGRKDGYSGRRTESQQSAESRASSGSGGLLGLLFGGGLKRIIILIVVIVAIVLLIRVCAGGCSIPEMGNLNVLENMLDGDGYDNLYADPNNTGSSGTSFATGALETLLGGTIDPTDATAPETVSASTSQTTVNTTVANVARDKYTTILGSGKDEVTLMVYLCGTDLESEYGMGTSDLNEMLHANLNDDKVNIIVETGGTKKWNNSVISNTTNQRYRVTSQGLEPLSTNMGRKSMIDPNTLAEFIQFCAKNYPANRYCLILWDHGGGAISGYGYDQYYSGSMTLDKIHTALKNGGVKFDFIGFDACLMGTLETALVCEKHADYLIASEESEPGCGWYYTNWLTELSKNTSKSTVELSKTIIDDFNNVCKKKYPGCNTTLSIIDLAEFSKTVPEPFAAFSKSVGELLDGNEYSTVSDARADVREFGKSSRVNHVDLVDLAKKINTSESTALVKALQGCIKYNRTSTSMANSYGLSIYFPYSSFSGMTNAVKVYDNIGMDADYTSAIKNFSSLAAGGQIATGGTTSSPIGSLLGSYTGSSGFSASSMLDYLLGGSSSSTSGAGSLVGSLIGGSQGGSDIASLFGSTLLGSSEPEDFLSTILGGSGSGWFDSGRVLQNRAYYDENSLSTADMKATKQNGKYVLSLSKEQWALVESVQLNVFVNDGEGFLDLGLDNVYELDAKGNLILEWDGAWIGIEGHIVPYYFLNTTTDNGVTTINGRVPALLNGELVNLMIVFENDVPSVVGYQKVYTGGETDTVAKECLPLENGDVLTFVCDYYDYDGNYTASYQLENSLTVRGTLKVEDMTVENESCRFCYCLTDLYGNEFWTESFDVE